MTGDCRDALPMLPDNSVQCIVTSPPYWGAQRDYGHPGQIGMEKTPEEFVAVLVAIFREVRRVLRDDGVLWLNLGDSYAASGKGGGGKMMLARGHQWGHRAHLKGWRSPPPGYKEKDLVGVPWMTAQALRGDGWTLRRDVVWNKGSATEPTRGPIPDGQYVLHTCDVRHCCNPGHLFLGTYFDNAQDAKAKSRTVWGEKNMHAKLTAEQVLEIRRDYCWNGKRGPHSESNSPDLAAKYGVSKNAIQAVVARRTWAHLRSDNG